MSLNLSNKKLKDISKKKPSIILNRVISHIQLNTMKEIALVKNIPNIVLQIPNIGRKRIPDIVPKRIPNIVPKIIPNIGPNGIPNIGPNGIPNIGPKNETFKIRVNRNLVVNKENEMFTDRRSRKKSHIQNLEIPRMHKTSTSDLHLRTNL